jgi:hypothetical protein
MANTWTYAAVRFEAGVVEPEREFGFSFSHPKRFFVCRWEGTIQEPPGAP